MLHACLLSLVDRRINEQCVHATCKTCSCKNRHYGKNLANKRNQLTKQASKLMCCRYGGSKLIIVHKQPKLLLTTISVRWFAPTWPVWPIVPEVEFNVCAFVIVFSKQHMYVRSFVYANHWFNVVKCFYYLWSTQSGIIKTKHWHSLWHSFNSLLNILKMSYII
jgi:hypothetical protein